MTPSGLVNSDKRHRARAIFLGLGAVFIISGLLQVAAGAHSFGVGTIVGGVLLVLTATLTAARRSD